MSARIVYATPEGEVRVFQPLLPRLKGESAAEYAQRMAAKGVPADTPWRAIDDSALPPRRFRAAWRVAGQSVHVDAPLARQQILAEVRAARKALLDDSDRDKARLDDVGSAEQKAALAAYRQHLRDLPALVASQIAALPAAELEAYSPAFPPPPGAQS